jgi:hypothetical protein
MNAYSESFTIKSIMLSVIMLSAIMLSVVMLNVVAPIYPYLSLYNSV